MILCCQKDPLDELPELTDIDFLFFPAVVLSALKRKQQNKNDQCLNYQLILQTLPAKSRITHNFQARRSSIDRPPANVFHPISEKIQQQHKNNIKSYYAKWTDMMWFWNCVRRYHRKSSPYLRKSSQLVELSSDILALPSKNLTYWTRKEFVRCTKSKLTTSSFSLGHLHLFRCDFSTHDFRQVRHSTLTFYPWWLCQWFWPR